MGSRSSRLNKRLSSRCIPVSLHSPAFISRSFAVTKINGDAEFKENCLQKSSQLIVIDWTADWCGPCRVIAPEFEKMSNEEDNINVKFVKVDVDSHMNLAQQYRVQALPTFTLFKNAQIIDQVIGADIAKLKSVVDLHKQD